MLSPKSCTNPNRHADALSRTATLRVPPYLGQELVLELGGAASAALAMRLASECAAMCHSAAGSAG